MIDNPRIITEYYKYSDELQNYSLINHKLREA